MEIFGINNNFRKRIWLIGLFSFHVIIVLLKVLFVEIFEAFQFRGADIDLFIPSIIPRVIGLVCIVFIIKKLNLSVYGSLNNPLKIANLLVFFPVLLFLSLLVYNLKLKDADLEILFFFSLTVLLVGLFEEFTINGLVLPILIKRFGSEGNMVVPVFYSSLIFGLLHIFIVFSREPTPPSLIITSVISAFCFGFVFAGVMLHLQNIYAVSLIHALFDFPSLFNQYVLKIKPADSGIIINSLADSLQLLPWLIFHTLVFLLGLFLVKFCDKETAFAKANVSSFEI